MTKAEYISAAKRINQRLVEAERVGSRSSVYDAVERALAKEGRRRLPERVGRLTDAELAPYMSIAQQYSGIRSFRAAGAKARPRRKMSAAEKAQKQKEAALRKEYKAIRTRVNKQLKEVFRIPGAMHTDVVTQLFSDIESYLRPGAILSATAVLPELEDIDPSKLKEAIMDLTHYSQDPHLNVKTFNARQRKQLENLSAEKRKLFAEGYTDKGAKKGSIWAIDTEERAERLRGYYASIFYKTLQKWDINQGGMNNLTQAEWAEVAQMVAEWNRIKQRGMIVADSDQVINDAIDIVLKSRKEETRSEYEQGKAAFEKAFEEWATLPADQLKKYKSFTSYFQTMAWHRG